MLQEVTYNQNSSGVAVCKQLIGHWWDLWTLFLWNGGIEVGFRYISKQMEDEKLEW